MFTDSQETREPTIGSADDAGPMLADLLASLAAIGRSMQEEFDPRRFLDEFSHRIRGMLPHDRLIVLNLDEDGKAFTVFAETGGPAAMHESYTSSFQPSAKFVVSEWTIRPVFSGETMLVNDVLADPRFARLSGVEERYVQEGCRSGLIVPMFGGGRVVGALAVMSFTPGLHAEGHVAVAKQIADLVAPFIQSTVLLHRERQRRRRLRALGTLTRVLATSLDARDVFGHLAAAVKPILDFDLMGAVLISASGRDLELLAAAGAPDAQGPPERIPLEHYSFSQRVEAGEAVVIQDATVELDAALPGDRRIIDGGGRSCMIVPLRFGEQVGGGLYFGKCHPYWFDSLDVELANGIAAQVVLAIQHQRLAEEQHRLAAVEGRARRLEKRLESLRDALDERYGFDQIIGRAPSLREALTLAAKVAPTETTVLVTGESGTGKELVARAIHYASARADGPFVTVNCAALPETLLESELFGHERGAFTGADRQKPGRFELAAGGTVFLDEVGELSRAVQAKLLRILQNREFDRVGGTTTLHADVRIIAATNRNLEQSVEAGRFREDLYYRLNVFRIHLPPLRERGEDVLLLADHFVRTLGARMGKGETGLSRDARDALLAHPWPGNIRELQNAIERALILSEGGLLTAAQFGIAPRKERSLSSAPPAEVSSAARPVEQSLAEWEKRMVLDVLNKTRWNKSQAAKILGITRSQLYTRLKKFSLDA
ncbi:MAG: sigma 54-interacting transcriptional regulator [candidate division NC10 bacterium]|nr:sigma 54-interacting transcriptional regulator [candidate division NC10 bacterium]